MFTKTTQLTPATTLAQAHHTAQTALLLN